MWGYPVLLFTDRRFLHKESFLHGSRLTHRRFYTQHFLNTDAFTHRCLCTGTNCTQKLVHIARVYTQPTFTQRGFAFPSCSPTFRVPPQVYFLIPYSYAHMHTCILIFIKLYCIIIYYIILFGIIYIFLYFLYCIILYFFYISYMFFF